MVHLNIYSWIYCKVFHVPWISLDKLLTKGSMFLKHYCSNILMESESRTNVFMREWGGGRWECGTCYHGIESLPMQCMDCWYQLWSEYLERGAACTNISIPLSLHPRLLCSNNRIFNILFCLAFPINRPPIEISLPDTVCVKKADVKRGSEKLIIFVYLY